MTQASIDTSDQTILSAWQHGICEASKDIAFKQALLHQEGKLLPCFVDHYQRLNAFQKHAPSPATVIDPPLWPRSSTPRLPIMVGPPEPMLRWLAVLQLIR